MSEGMVHRGCGTRLLRRVLAVAALTIGPSVALAQEAPAEAEQPVNTGRISLQAGVDFPTQYIFRGIRQEDSGFIAQPWGTVNVNLYSDPEGAINTVNVFFSTWNSLHSEQTGADDDGADIWYETDFSTGLTVGLLDNWSAGVSYVAYVSPNDAFNTVQEIDVSVSYNDEAFWDALGLKFGGLQPSALLAVEFDNQADGGSDKGTYLQLGIKPAVNVIESESMPVKLSFPIMVGLSLDKDYYESGRDSDVFGFFSAGAVFSMPLTFIPREFGTWEAYAGAHLMTLGESADDFNDGDTPDWEILGTFGFSMSY